MGWHVPTDYEWAYMLDLVEGDGTGTTFRTQAGAGWIGSDAGQKMKTTGTYSGTDPADGSWIYHSTNNSGTDIYNFSMVGTGVRYQNGSSFGVRNQYACVWSSCVVSATVEWHREWGHATSAVKRAQEPRSRGHAVRCVRD